MGPAGVRVHRRQYMLTDQPILAGPDWVAEEIAPGRILSRCPDLRRHEARDAVGGRWILLGRALATETGRPDPEREVEGAAPGEVPRLVEGWTGRWLLIGPDAVLPDASALLGCLHGRTAEGALFLTSSPALGGVGRRPRDARRLRLGNGMCWSPPPLTRADGLRRLLPSQTLDLATGEPRPRRLVPPVPEADLGAAAERLMGRLATALGRAAAAGPLLLGLTGGADSRAVLAVAAHAGVPVAAHTHHMGPMSLADRTLPPRLAAAVGMTHDVHRERPPTGDRHGMLAAHAAGSVSDGDALPFLTGTRDALRGLLLLGQGFDVAAGPEDWPPLPPEPPSAGALAALLGEPPEGPVAEGLAAWLDWAAWTPDAGLDWRVRLRIEQHHAGRLAAKEQAYDMQDVERVPLLNGAAIRADLLAPPPAERRGRRLQAALVARAAPPLAAFVVNPPDWRHLRTHPGRAALSIARGLRARRQR